MLFDQIFSFVSKFKPKYDDDVVDRLNYVYTNWLIVLFSIIVACRQYIGSPLECWVPAQFQRGWEEYVENYCFVESTYYVAMEEEMPNSLIERGNRRLKYYQWVPLILALEAFLFYFPRFIWRAFHWKAGLDITSIMQHAMTTEKVGKLKVLKTQKKEDMTDLAQYFDDVLKHQVSGSDDKSLFAKVLSNHCGMYITLLYLFVKLLNIINVFSQLAILNGFLGPEYTWWGVEILNDLLKGRQWEDSGHFPRVTMCDVTIRAFGNIQTWSVQCVLVMNMFNEKIFLFLWWWFCLVGVLTTLNFLYWLTISVCSSSSYSFIRRYLDYEGEKAPSASEMDKFINRTLRTDGITVLRLVSDNCGDIVTAELVLYLWKKRNDHRGTSVQGASENAFQEVSAAALDPNGAAIDGSNNQGTQTNFFGELESVLDGRNARVRSRTTTATN